jgi:hypothetical protein
MQLYCTERKDAPDGTHDRRLEAYCQLMALLQATGAHLQLRMRSNYWMRTSYNENQLLGAHATAEPLLPNRSCATALCCCQQTLSQWSAQVG